MMYPESDTIGVERAARLTALRKILRADGLAAFLVPKADEFQNESVPAYADRLRFLTGFTGSAGMAVVTGDRAALIVDSRYTLQAKAEADAELFTIEPQEQTPLPAFLAGAIGSGETVGFDPRLHTVSGIKPLRDEARKRGFTLQECRENPIERIWHSRPAARFAPIFRHDEAYAGENAASKIVRVQETLSKDRCDGLLISAADSVAWLFNVRGRDVDYTPLPLTRAFVPRNGKPMLFVQEGHTGDGNRDTLEAVAAIHPIGSMETVLRTVLKAGSRVLIDPTSTTVHTAEILARINVESVEAPDPCVLFKARKNAVELRGAVSAHTRDGVAFCKFLAWLHREGQTGAVDELGASARLLAFRQETTEFEGSSFETISGAGPNGAIVHYRSSPSTNRPLLSGSLYLVDSGAQYKDGTTDVTRTIAIGAPTEEMRRHFTLVLRGHIALATARFPANSRGVDLDGFARRPLWEAGLVYGHGTGHGVGSFLSVHEGPQSISRSGMAALQPGMIVSNEPGHYREGHYGIRIENLMAVTEAALIEGGEVAMMAFETLTLAPIDRFLIAKKHLTRSDTAWIDSYHARVANEIGPLLAHDEADWLAAATAPL